MVRLEIHRLKNERRIQNEKEIDRRLSAYRPGRPHRNRRFRRRHPATLYPLPSMLQWTPVLRDRHTTFLLSWNRSLSSLPTYRNLGRGMADQCV